ncbi:MAG TPA: B12-binding domain-containing radical SAM protein, partial [Proteobacteria bacterium]|nr:B12-binding domain-containing radical SAM protein [Pseudomonadota bacterium]
MEEFLQFIRSVERPSRYLGLETNRVQKDPSEVKLRVCLAFPDLYEIGQSHLGFELVYRLFNAHPDVYCERAFLPAPDAASYLRSHNIKLFSLETKTPLDEFDLLAFSFTYELHYTSVLEMLSLSGLQTRSADRRGLPLVVAGGIGCSNPEPMVDFIDAFAIGDGEVLVPKLIEVMLDVKARSMKPARREILERLADTNAFYVPLLVDEGKQR